jgi:hypothetical protein
MGDVDDSLPPSQTTQRGQQSYNIPAALSSRPARPRLVTPEVLVNDDPWKLLIDEDTDEIKGPTVPSFATVGARANVGLLSSWPDAITPIPASSGWVNIVFDTTTNRFDDALVHSVDNDPPTDKIFVPLAYLYVDSEGNKELYQARRSHFVNLGVGSGGGGGGYDGPWKVVIGTAAGDVDVGPDRSVEKPDIVFIGDKCLEAISTVVVNDSLPGTLTTKYVYVEVSQNSSGVISLNYVQSATFPTLTQDKITKILAVIQADATGILSVRQQHYGDINVVITVTDWDSGSKELTYRPQTDYTQVIDEAVSCT